MQKINLKKFFTENHTQRNWATPETVSGVGSELQYTNDLRARLAAFIAQNNIATMLDIPCGDVNWVKQMLADHPLPGFEYTGADIAPNLIEENRANFPALQFKVLDVTTSQLPAVDLIFVRDCLVHLPIEFVFKALANLAKSNAQFIAMTTFPCHPGNEELLEMGGWRTLNLQQAPFNLPAPLHSIEENCQEYGGVFSDKMLGVWTPAQIKEAISANTSNL